jgi:tetratricopeptide (TPR) repeat protein/SAM-dependent methyltransferase
MSRKDRRAAASIGKGGGKPPSGPPAAALFAAALHHHRGGQLGEAERLYRQLLALEPGHAPALHFLGILCHQAGNSAAAVELIGRALAVDGTIPDFHYNLGVILESLGRHEEAAARYRAATALKPDHFGASLNLGNVLIAEGRLDEAETACRRAVGLNPQSVEARFNLGTALARQQRYADAAVQLSEAVRLKPDFAPAHASLGAALLAARDHDGAARHLRGALALVPRHHQAAVNLGHAELALGHEAEALEAALAALDIEESREAKALFGRAARHARPRADAPRFRDLIGRALVQGWDNPVHLVFPAVALLKMDPVLRPALDRFAAAGAAKSSLAELVGDGLGALAQDRVLVALLQAVPVSDAEMERFLAALRRALVDEAAAAAALPAGGLEILCALARQCFVNEYVYAWGDAERDAAMALRDRLAAALATGQAIPPLWIAATAAYFPLGSIAGADRLPERAWPTPVAALLTQQVAEPATEQTLRAELPRLTAVEDPVSIAVKQQYEENPYPRWISAGPLGPAVPIDAYFAAKFPAAAGYRPLGPEAPSILIAGCGTGRHAIEISQRFAAADVLAIDLSEASLGYALRKTRELGLTNLRYGVADILALAPGGRSFDVIEASGVLHHLADPFAAWRRLLTMLRPGGVMNVGLYSELARADVVRVRGLLAERDMPATADGIRRCREELIAVPDEPLLTSPDFYSLSGCRDLLFHVQESRVTLPQVGAFIAETGLVFLGFDADTALLEHYAREFPADAARTDLASWHRFESANPRSFAGMYQFWVQKP